MDLIVTLDDATSELLDLWSRKNARVDVQAWRVMASMSVLLALHRSWAHYFIPRRLATRSRRRNKPRWNAIIDLGIGYRGLFARRAGARANVRHAAGRLPKDRLAGSRRRSRQCVSEAITWPSITGVCDQGRTARHGVHCRPPPAWREALRDRRANRRQRHTIAMERSALIATDRLRPTSQGLVRARVSRWHVSVFLGPTDWQDCRDGTDQPRRARAWHCSSRQESPSAGKRAS